jgi:hypothetical protein
MSVPALGLLAVLAFLLLRRLGRRLSGGSNRQHGKPSEQHERQERGGNPHTPAIDTLDTRPVHEDRRSPSANNSSAQSHMRHNDLEALSFRC